MIDVCYVVRPGDVNEELRHSLRSVAANLPHRDVVVAGHRPAWAKVRHLPTAQAQAKHVNALTNLRAILDCQDLTEQVIVANDDMFVTAPLEQIPTLHSGPLTDARHLADSVTSRAYWDTLGMLDRLGVKDPLCYDLHTPFVVDRSQLAKTLHIIQTVGAHPAWDPDRTARILWKTVHANLWGYAGDHSGNVKVIDLTPQAWPAPFLSTIDLAFGYGAVGGHIRALFPDPCRYEET